MERRRGGIAQAHVGATGAGLALGYKKGIFFEALRSEGWFGILIGHIASYIERILGTGGYEFYELLEKLTSQYIPEEERRQAEEKAIKLLAACKVEM